MKVFKIWLTIMLGTFCIDNLALMVGYHTNTVEDLLIIIVLACILID